MVIVGGGGHGLATAHYLAKNHGITNVAVLERSWLAGGNMARNTTLIRSNYLWDESSAIYEHSLKLWEGLEEDLDYPILFSQRGVLNLAHSLQDVRDSVRRVEANKLNGIDAEWLPPDEVKKVCPIVNTSPGHPLPGAGRDLPAPRGHRQARLRRLGLCPARRRRPASTSSRTARYRLRVGRRAGSPAVRTTRGDIAAGQVALCAAGTPRCSPTCSACGCPLQSHPLQALVSELLEPVHPTVVMSNAVHVYVSQAHKGELVMGAGVDSYNGYGQRGAFHVIERQMAAAVELFPVFARAHLLRSWAGIVDVCPDASPIVGRTPVRGPVPQLRLGHRRVQGDPGHRRCLAHTIAHDEPHPLRRAVQPRAVRHRRPRRRARRRRASPTDRTAPPGDDRMQLIDHARGAGPARRSSSTTAARRTCPTRTTRPRCPTRSGRDYLFFRDNTKGLFAERWVHAAGCRRWFNAIRDTATYRFHAVYRLDEPKPVIS